MKVVMTINLINRKVQYIWFAMSIIIFSCTSSKFSQKEVLEGVLKQTLSQYDINDSILMKGIVMINDTSIVLHESDQNSIKKHHEEIIKDNEKREVLIKKLLNEKEKEVFQDIHIPGFILKSERHNQEAIGIVYISRLIFIEDDPSTVLFFYMFRCGSDCGSGNIVFAKRIKGNWVLEEVYPLYLI